jgi:hypothetical protein
MPSVSGSGGHSNGGHSNGGHSSGWVSPRAEPTGVAASSPGLPSPPPVLSPVPPLRPITGTKASSASAASAAAPSAATARASVPRTDSPGWAIPLNHKFRCVGDLEVACPTSSHPVVACRGGRLPGLQGDATTSQPHQRLCADGAYTAPQEGARGGHRRRHGPCA